MPLSEPEEVLKGHSSINVSFHSKADARPVGHGISAPNSDLASPWHSAPRNMPFYPERDLPPWTPKPKRAGM